MYVSIWNFFNTFFILPFIEQFLDKCLHSGHLESPTLLRYLKIFSIMLCQFFFAVFRYPRLQKDPRESGNKADVMCRYVHMYGKNDLLMY